MDRNAFDGLTKLLGATPSRRAALGALLGAGLSGWLGGPIAARKDRAKKRKPRMGKGKGAAHVSAQAADCLSPGPSSNMNGCDFGGDPFGGGADFSGDDLSGSSMVGTIFRNAVLVGTDLSSSTMKNANFRGANLTCADLSSSTLRNADFRGFAPLGRPTNLTGADLRSSGGCGTVLTNQFTVLCGTTWCDGSVRNDACPGGTDACCAADDCPSGETCQGNECRCGSGPGCSGGQVCVTVATQGTCATPCSVQEDCPGCSFCITVFGGRFCAGAITGSTCAGIPCPTGEFCTASGFCREACTPS